MYRRAIRTLFVAAALLLTTTACDKGDAKGGDAKGGDAKGDTKKAAADEGAKVDDGGAKADDGGTVAAEAEAEAGAGETGGPGEAVAAEAGGEEAGAGETGGAVAASAGGEEGGAKADDGGGEEGGKDDGDKAPKKPESTPKIDGKPLFEKKCKSCHGIDGKGDTTIGKKVDIPSLAKTSMSKSKIVSVIEKGVPDTKMKAYKDKLSKEEIDAVAAYVKKL